MVLAHLFLVLNVQGSRGGFPLVDDAAHGAAIQRVTAQRRQQPEVQLRLQPRIRR